jgi:hypothetical protein
MHNKKKKIMGGATYVICTREIGSTLRILFRTHTVHCRTCHIRITGRVATISVSKRLQLMEYVQ